MKRLVVVSNRVAVPKGSRPAPGGLAVGVLSALEETSGVWFGWNGQVEDEPPDQPENIRQDGVEFVTLPLARRDYDQYYRGFSNRVLWPWVHGRLDLTEYNARDLQGYLRVNSWLAEHLLDLLEPGDVVWVHDYHLFPLATAMREGGFKGPVGFFLHTPFPSHDVCRALPGHRRLLRWLAEYDVVGFQTDLDERAFRQCLDAEFETQADGDDRIELDGKRFATGVFPIGIDLEQVAEQSHQGRAARQGQRLLERLDGRRLILGVDRLDYSKGLIGRFEAYGRLLDDHPQYSGQVMFMQIAQPSRHDVPEYQSIRRRLDTVAGEITGSHADYDWVPIHYVQRSFARPSVLGFLAVAHVGFVTPLRDGMNLVAKEFVGVQDPDDPGVLVLSCLAGAARELEAALLVNPYDIDGMVEALDRGLSMPLSERRERYAAMMEVLARNDVHAWCRRFLSTLVESGDGR